MKIRRSLKTAMPALLSVFVVACGGDMSDLQQYIAEVKQRPGGRIEPLPQIKPYETFRYRADDRRSPFVPEQREAQSGKPKGPTPIENRNKEYLEQFPLDTLAMVGTFEKESSEWVLIRDPDDVIHRVAVGNYMGQNHGKVGSITNDEVHLSEFIADGVGGWLVREASISLDDG